MQWFRRGPLERPTPGRAPEYRGTAGGAGVVGRSGRLATRWRVAAAGVDADLDSPAVSGGKLRRGTLVRGVEPRAQCRSLPANRSAIHCWRFGRIGPGVGMNSRKHPAGVMGPTCRVPPRCVACFPTRAVVAPCGRARPGAKWPATQQPSVAFIATVAQLAEQRFCKPQVAGSSPAGGFETWRDTEVQPLPIASLTAAPR